MSYDSKKVIAITVVLLVVFSGLAGAGNEGGEIIYTASNTIAVVDIDAGKVLREIPLQHVVTDIVFSGTGERAYVATSVGVYVLDTGTHQVLKQLTDLPAKTLELSPDYSILYVLDHPLIAQEDGSTKGGPYQIKTVDLSTGKTLHTQRLGEGYFDFYLAGDGQTIFTLHYPVNSIDVFDTRTWQKSRTISIDTDELISKSAGSRTRSELYIPQYGTKGYLWVLNTISDRVHRIELEEELPLRGIAFSPETNRLFILTLGRIISVDIVSGTVVRKVSTDAPYQGISCGRDGKKIYLTNPIYRSGGSVTVMDAESLAVEKVIDIPTISPVTIATKP